MANGIFDLLHIEVEFGEGAAGRVRVPLEKPRHQLLGFYLLQEE